MTRGLLEKDLEFAADAEDVRRFAKGRSLLVRQNPGGFPVRLDYGGGKLAGATFVEDGGEAEGFRQAAGIPETTGYTGAFSVCGAVIFPYAPDGERVKPEFIAWDCAGFPGLTGIAAKCRRLTGLGFHAADCRETVPDADACRIQKLQSYLDHFGPYPAAFLVFEHGGGRIALRCRPVLSPRGTASRVKPRLAVMAL